MDWTCIEEELDSHYQDCSALDTRWKMEKRDTGNNMAHDSRRRVKTTSTGWSTVEKAAKDRLQWRNLVTALCASGRYGNDVSELVSVLNFRST